MHDRTARQEHRSLNRLIGETIQSFRDLVSSEIALFKEETTVGIQTVINGLVAIILGAVFAIVTVTLLVEALVEWLAVILESEALAAGAVALGTAVVAAVAIIFGLRQLSNFSLTPDRTIRSVKRDAEILSEKVA